MKYLVVLKYGGWKSWMSRAGLWEYSEGLRSSRRIQNWSKEHHPFRSLLLLIPSPQSRSILLVVTLIIFSPDGCLFSDDTPPPGSPALLGKLCGSKHYFLVLFSLLALGHTRCHAKLPGPGIEHAASAVSVQRMNHWTTREVPLFLYVVLQSDYL